METVIADRASFLSTGLSRLLLRFGELSRTRNCYGLRPVAVMQIEVYNGCVCESTSLRSVLETDEYIINPTKPYA